MSGIHSDEEEATARPFVAWFGRAQGRLGFVELVDLGGQNEIALRQTVDLVRPSRDRPCRYAQSCVLACGDHFIPQSRASANRAGFSVWFRRGVVMPGSVPEAVQLADMQRL